MKNRGEDGTVTLLIVGLTAVLLALVGVVTDVSTVVLAKRALASAADGAAAAAAQQVDAAAVRRNGLGGAVPLDAGAAAAAVAEAAASAQDDQPGLELDVSVTGATATVRARRDVRLPFVGWFGIDPVVTVRAVSVIRSPVSG